MLIIKVGGGKTINWEAVCIDVKKLLDTGEKLVIVHGASTVRDEIGKRMNVPTQTVTSPSGISSVYTDEKALSVFLMAYAGVSNTTIVARLIKHGISAIGLSGVDARLWQAKAKPNLMVKEGNKVRLLRDNHTGRVEKVNASLLSALMKGGYTPVICAPAITLDGNIVNTDNDRAAALTAGALKVHKLLYLFEAQGLLRNVTDPTSYIKHIKKNKLVDAMQFAQGRMKKKLLGAQIALEQGVDEVFFGDGRIENPIISLLNGVGTIIS